MVHSGWLNFWVQFQVMFWIAELLLWALAWQEPPINRVHENADWYANSRDLKHWNQMSFGFMCFKSLDGTYRQGNFVENTLRAKHALHRTEDQTHQKWKYWTVIWGHGFLPCRPVSKKARGDRSEAFVEVGRIAHSPIRCQHGMDSLWSLEYARKCCVRILMYDHVCTCCLDV